MFRASSLKTPCHTLLLFCKTRALVISRAGHWWCRRRCHPWCCWRCSNLWELQFGARQRARRTKLRQHSMQCLLALHIDHQYMNHIEDLWRSCIIYTTNVYIAFAYCFALAARVSAVRNKLWLCFRAQDQDINQMIFSWPLLHWSPRYGPSGTFASRNAAIYSYGKVEGGQFGVVVVGVVELWCVGLVWSHVMSDTILEYLDKGIG